MFTDQQARNVPGLEFDPEGVAAPLWPGMVVPLTSGHWRVGVLSLARRRGAAGYDQEEFRFTRAFAEQAALAMRGAADQNAQRDLELLRERERIARDLHDDVIQELFAIGLAMKSTQRTVEPAAAAARVWPATGSRADAAPVPGLADLITASKPDTLAGPPGRVGWTEVVRQAMRRSAGTCHATGPR